MSLGTVAITGANGVLGKVIAEALADRWTLRLLDIEPNQGGAGFRHVDVLSLPTLRHALKGCDAVVHLAAVQFSSDQASIFQVNTIGTWNVLQAAKDAEVERVVLLSSECATGILALTDVARAKPDYLPIDEAHPLRPVEAYGLSKQVAEVVGRAFSRGGGPRVVALRPTTVYVPGMESQMRKARDEDDPYLWLYVEGFDVADAVRLALEYDGPAYDCFFIAARDTFAKERTIDLVERKLGSGFEVRNPDLYEVDPHATIFDLRRAERLLGFAPRSDWRRFLSDEEPN